MGSESLQHKLDRVRRPRVQITYDVHTDNATITTELPFVMGIMADLSGSPKNPLPGIKERKFIDIDRDNFNHVMSRQGVRAAFTVENKLKNDNTKLNVELNFKHIEDFEPAKVAAQVPALKELLDMRTRLEQLLSKMEGNDALVAQLEEIIGKTEQLRRSAAEGGVQ